MKIEMKEDERFDSIKASSEGTSFSGPLRDISIAERKIMEILWQIEQNSEFQPLAIEVTRATSGSTTDIVDVSILVKLKK